MSRTVKVVFTDAMYDAIIDESASDGQLSAPGQGAAVVVRKATRAWLNKQGHRALELDMDDKSYHKVATNDPMGLPGTRKG